MHIRFRFSADEKFWQLDPPRLRKFGVIDTPQNFRGHPPISQKRIERPQIFFHCCIQHPNISQAAKL